MSKQPTVADDMRAAFVEGAAVLEKPYTAEGLAEALSKLLRLPLKSWHS